MGECERGRDREGVKGKGGDRGREECEFRNSLGLFGENRRWEHRTEREGESGRERGGGGREREGERE